MQVGEEGHLLERVGAVRDDHAAARGRLGGRRARAIPSASSAVTSTPGFELSVRAVSPGVSCRPSSGTAATSAAASSWGTAPPEAEPAIAMVPPAASTETLPKAHGASIMTERR